MDNKRKCYDCKHYVKTKTKPEIYGCELWDCKFSKKEETEHEEGRSGRTKG